MKPKIKDIDALMNDESAGVDTGRTRFADMETVKKSVPGLKAFVVIMGFLAAGSFGLFIWNQTHKPPAKDTETAAQKAAHASSLPGRRFADTPAPVARTPGPGDAPATVTDGPASAPVDPAVAARAAEAARQAKYEADILNRRLGKGSGAASGDAGGSDQGSYKYTNTGAGGAASDAVAAGPGPGQGPTPASKDSAALQERMGGAQVMRVHATRLLHPRFTVAGGTMIPCGTTTELDTTVPGQVSCTVTRDVYSADGTVRLIDKGAKVTGEVSGGIKQGQARVFALWTRLRNPDNVTINLMSPGAGQLGAAGIPGQVDSHFWTRFGGAMFVSVFTDGFKGLLQIAANSVNSGGSQTINLDSTSQTSNTLAQEALRATIDIPPTLYAAQASNINIYVRNDLDFSDVYGLAVQNADSDEGN
ncbi:type IV secretion system protein VirB10 [Paraburkholderia sp. GAS32]|uniref:type IV secretion system protein VirB10 n=1 Tax=Paraburkholderia sp. GAS32 TaxID=3035129 RepID=UPI003D21FCDD